MGEREAQDESTAKENPEHHTLCTKFPSPSHHVDFFDSRALQFCSNSTSTIVVV